MVQSMPVLRKQNTFPVLRPVIDILPPGVSRPTIDLNFVRQGAVPAGGVTVNRGSVKYTGRSGDGLLVQAPNATLRTDHDTNGVPLGWLIENSSTNLLSRSEEFDNAYWSKNGTTVTANQGVAPDGTTTADLFEADDGTNDSVFRVITGVAADTDITLSVYIALAPGSATPAADSNVQIVLFGDVVGTVVNSIGSNLTSSFQRFQVSAVTDASPTNFTAQIGLIGGADSEVDLLVWGAQVEAKSLPSSYIKTTTGSALRAADIVLLVQAAALWNEPEGTVFMEFLLPNPVGALNRGLVRINDNTGNEEINFYNKNTQVMSIDVDSAGNPAEVNMSTSVVWSAGDIARGAFAYKVNDVALFGNDATPVVDTGNTPPTGVNRIRIGHAAPGMADMHIRRFMYWPMRLPNQLLRELTT